ncbi:MAG: phosphatase domain-containing protein [Candidatus Nanopelagicales bacterium]
MVDWLQFGADMEDLATQTLRTGKRATGTLGPSIIQPYRGFVADGVAHVRARVMEKPVFDTQAGGLRIDATLAANLLRWVVLDMAGVEVTVTVAGNSVVVNSNADGFVIAKVPVGDIAPGWHEVRFSATDRGRDVTARGRVVLPDPASTVGFITDIDDTILTTGMTEGLKALRRTLLRDAYGRKPVPGTPSLYRGLARGSVTRPESTFFYVSSGPWNLYDMLVQFLGVRGFPRGPLFLTDWRPGSPTSDDEGKFESHHKSARIRRILDAYPDMSFVLIGDSGEKDREIYEQFLESDPDRIQVALIRDLDAPARDADADSADVATGGLVTVRDSIEMAEIAQKLGLIDELTVEEVMTEIDARL